MGFNSEKAAERDATKANGKQDLAKTWLQDTINSLTESDSFSKSEENLFIYHARIIYNDRVKMGDIDDIAQARNETLDNLYIAADKQHQDISRLPPRLKRIQEISQHFVC